MENSNSHTFHFFKFSFLYPLHIYYPITAQHFIQPFPYTTGAILGNVLFETSLPIFVLVSCLKVFCQIATLRCLPQVLRMFGKGQKLSSRNGLIIPTKKLIWNVGQPER